MDNPSWSKLELRCTRRSCHGHPDPPSRMSKNMHIARIPNKLNCNKDEANYRVMPYHTAQETVYGRLNRLSCNSIEWQIARSEDYIAMEIRVIPSHLVRQKFISSGVAPSTNTQLYFGVFQLIWMYRKDIWRLSRRCPLIFRAWPERWT